MAATEKESVAVSLRITSSDEGNGFKMSCEGLTFRQLQDTVGTLQSPLPPLQNLDS